MAAYFELLTGLSRGVTDATSKKRACTWKREYFRFEDGVLLALSEYEDGLLYASQPLRLPVPPLAEPSTATAFAEAQQRCEAYQRQERAKRRAEKASKRLLTSPAGAAGEDEPDEEPSNGAPPAAPLLDDFTVLDTEFVPAGAHLLEVAAIRYRQFEPEPPLQSFVRFTGTVPRQITELTGITARDVARAPSEVAVLRSLRAYAGNSLLVAHNISADRRILEAARTRAGATEPLPNPWLCTLALAKKRLPRGQKCGLLELCQHFGIAGHGAHRALRDVQMCFEVLRRLHAQQPVGREAVYRDKAPALFAA